MEIQTISVDGEYTVPLGPIAGVSVHGDYEFIFSGTFMTARQYEFALNEECNVFEKNVTWDELLIQVNLDCDTGEITLLQVILDATSEGPELISRPFDGEVYTEPKFIGETLSNHDVCTEFGISVPPLIVADNGTAVAELAT